MTARLRVIALAALVAGCGFAGETGDSYRDSLAAKSVWSALQQVEWKLREAPKKPYVYNAAASAVDTIAFPAKDGHGYVAFTAKAPEGRVLSVPEDRRIAVDLVTLRELQKRGMVSDAVVAELVRRSS